MNSWQQSPGTCSSHPRPNLQRSWNIIFAVITERATNPRGSKNRPIQLRITLSVMHRSSGIWRPLKLKQSSLESHSIPRTLRPFSTHLSWSSLITRSLICRLLDTQWVRFILDWFMTSWASRVMLHASSWSSQPEIQLSTYIFSDSFSTTREGVNLDKWCWTVAFSRNGLLLLPKGTRVKRITLMIPWSSQRNLCTSLSSRCTSIWRKALVMSAHNATFQRWNLNRMPTRSGSKFGPVSKQSLRDTWLRPFAEASNTGRTFVFILDSLTTGLWGIKKMGRDTLSWSTRTSSMTPLNSISRITSWYLDSIPGSLLRHWDIRFNRPLARFSLFNNLDLSKFYFQGRATE